MANWYMKKFSIAIIIRKIKMKSTTRYYFTPVRLAIVKRQKITGVGEDADKSKYFHWYIVGRSINLYKHFS